jgi:hypothetical protein
MGKWLARLADERSETLARLTLETIKTPILKVLKVPTLRVSEESRGAAALRAAPMRVIEAAEARTCADCTHQLKPGTCGEPVAAGLAPKFEIRWAPEGHGATCEAFTSNVQVAGAT